MIEQHAEIAHLFARRRAVEDGAHDRAVAMPLAEMRIIGPPRALRARESSAVFTIFATE